MTVARIVVKFKGSLEETHKMAIKSLGGIWDDLFMAWNLPLEAYDTLCRILKEIGKIYDKREVILPKTYVHQSKRSIAMYGKYAAILKKLIHEETRLLIDIERYECKRLRTDERPRAFHFFQEKPVREGLSEMSYLIENTFYLKWKELADIRKEINQLHEELKALD